MRIYGLTDDFTGRVANSEEESCQLIEGGFESYATSEATSYSEKGSKELIPQNVRELF
jgi:hypothetical protein